MEPFTQNLVAARSCQVPSSGQEALIPYANYYYEYDGQQITNATNDFIAKTAPDVNVKQSLRKQSNLYSALDNIAPKAADEAGNAISRLWQNTKNVIPIKSDIGKGLGFQRVAESNSGLFVFLVSCRTLEKNLR